MHTLEVLVAQPHPKLNTSKLMLRSRTSFLEASTSKQMELRSHSVITALK